MNGDGTAPEERELPPDAGDPVVPPGDLDAASHAEAGADDEADGGTSDGDVAANRDASVLDARVASDAATNPGDAAPLDGAADAASDAQSADVSSVNTTPMLPTKSGTCPPFVSGDADFSPAGVATRKVRLWVGTNGGGPLVIYWHSTNNAPSEAESAGLSGVITQITAAGGVVAAPYTGSNDGTFPWLQTTAESLKIADEVVACALEKKSIDARRIHAIGFSAGGLMTSTMGLQRSNYIASVVPYSGGLQGTATFQDASNKFAALIFYGGSSDTFLINFQSTSTAYSTALRQNGNYTALCNHGGGHAIPSAGPAAAWRFFQDHHFRTAPSPYLASGLPASFPSYCQTQP